MKLFIKTFGCQMNEYDSERIAAIFQERGYSLTDNLEEASFAVINTCSVREKPYHKVESELGRLKKFKKLNPDFKIAVCGCVAQQDGEKFLDRFDYVDLVFGTSAIDRLHSLIDLVEKGERICDTSEGDDELSIPVFGRGKKVSAFVTIMKGCDNFCSYCIVPYVRGREKSRKPSEILDEIKYLVNNGVKEVTLLGQNVNSYGKGLDEDINFPKLLYKVHDINGLERIRFVTSHPKDFDDELIFAIRDLPKVCEYLHLPLQAGSNKVLKMMNRKYTYEEYRDKVLKAKEMIPDLALSSDFIVGFPGETVEDFAETLKAIKEIRYESIFAFKYSPRPKTKASNFVDDITDDEKSRRLNELLSIQSKITEEINKSYVGKVQEILVEGKSKKGENQFSGRNRQNKVVNILSNHKLNIGDIVTVEIVEAKKNSLLAKIVEFVGR
ncbi:tRNA-i(6)A37 thiotransferase enzyme [Deferribacter desulfuricans SSM1]|uniref:tRNA-2-methylthio-N(6)-dimethylallyladenosine synthase n=1 Tax=Deferribacter desulfuricans (strain DSM 14783 / JCM 11476 / NBRC 101012 / SSM1) TaxID=639282 RepID=D3PE29_DEFDS|nr:tRNA (N6-isopentenyl adenosine(37)-C2)-methylthiotransferase MiaB [Deferribacter desulfuricans]BAI80852.1 tRNA-i(6)A37 thiotransferase enzyme [Deferribacter desulfuricans SSM1]